MLQVKFGILSLMALVMVGCNPLGDQSQIGQEFQPGITVTTTTTVPGSTTTTVPSTTTTTTTTLPPTTTTTTLPPTTTTTTTTTTTLPPTTTTTTTTTTTLPPTTTTTTTTTTMPLDHTWNVNSGTSFNYTATSSIQYTATTAEHKDMHIDNSDDAIGFAGGTKTNVEWSNPQLQLNVTGMTARSGSFTSRLFSSPSSRMWNSLEIATNKPAGKPLPNGAITETVYASENINMTGNKLLLHMEQSSWNGTASEIIDSSGSLHHGSAKTTLGTAPSTIADGKYGRAAAFNAAQTQYLEVPHHNDFDNQSNLTVEAWVYPTNVDAANPRGIVSKRVNSNASQTAWAMFVHTNQRLTVDINGTSVGSERFVRGTAGGTPVPNNQWVHLAFTFNGSGTNVPGNKRLKAYVNGVEEFEGQNNVAIMRNLATSNINIGFLTGNTDSFLSGRMDEVAIYQRTLAASEIVDRYNRGLRRLKFQAAVCMNTGDCSVANMVGPDGTNSSYFTAASTFTNTHPVLNTTSLGFGTHMRYRAFYETDLASENVGLRSVTVSPVLYDYLATVRNNTSVGYRTLTDFTAGTTGDVTFQVSDGTNWYYWNGAWSVASTNAESNSKNVIQTNISTFPTQNGTGSLSFKAILNSGTEGEDKASLTNVRIQGSIP